MARDTDAMTRSEVVKTVRDLNDVMGVDSAVLCDSKDEIRVRGGIFTSNLLSELVNKNNYNIMMSKSELILWK